MVSYKNQLEVDDVANKKYIVIKADIINSRQSEERNAIQKSLSKALETINDTYDSSIASKFMITSGDGFQGLMTIGTHLFDIIQLLEISVAPLKLRFGIGIGSVSTDIDEDNSAIIDGPSYHYADEMLTCVKSLEGQYSSISTNILLKSNRDHDEILNALLNMRYVVRSSWTKRQHEVITTFIEMNENQYETASKLNVNQSTVSRALKSTDYYSVKSAEVALINYIESTLL